MSETLAEALKTDPQIFLRCVVNDMVIHIFGSAVSVPKLDLKPDWYFSVIF